MEIKRIPTGQMMANCYLIWNKNTNNAIVIDPGDSADKIISYIDENKLVVKKILLTHGHFDHIGALDKIRKYTNAPVYVHKNDANCVTDSNYNLSILVNKNIFCENDAEFTINDGYIIGKGEFDIKVIHTPGHSKGSVCYLMGNHLFSGDTLFPIGIGRTDLYGGDYDKLIDSIKNKLLILPDSLIMYPGHGEVTDFSKVKSYH
jgi:glyoxylase-like metal-dependent hydrolase (beta-lactamase superfamily II)